MNLHSRYAILVNAAEEMFTDDHLYPELPTAFTDEWHLRGWLIAENGLLGLQALPFIGEKEYFGFLAQSNTDPTQYVAVIRGTEQQIEWLENMQGALLPILGKRPGMVEHGFWSIYDTMILQPAPGGIIEHDAALGISALINDNATLTIIGHSLGAALATYLATDVGRKLVEGMRVLERSQRRFNLKLVAFASPRPGDGTFAVDADVNIGRDNYVVHNYMRDVVTHVPPSLPFGLGFQHLPGVQWITSATAHAEVPNTAALNHNALSYAAMLDADAIPFLPAEFQLLIKRK